MVAEVDAMYAETRAETGLASMSPAVRAALGKVERHRLVPPAQASAAYRNHPLPIGAGQTISQPYIVALSTDLLNPKPGDVVLDVGTGSGYQAAVLAEIVSQVYSIELVESLGKTAAARLAEMGYRNIEVKIGDGYAGWPEKGAVRRHRRHRRRPAGPDGARRAAQARRPHGDSRSAAAATSST